jgi:hypothetical protein
MIATILFSYDELIKKNKKATETQIYEYVINWKPHWIDKQHDIESTIKALSMLDWMRPDTTQGSLNISDDCMY